MLARSCSKIFQARLHQYMNWEFPYVQAGFQRGRGTRDKISNIHWNMEKATVSEKASTSSLTILKPLTVWVTTNCGKFLKKWESQTSLPVSWEACMWVKKLPLEPYMEYMTSSKLGKKYIKAVYCHPVYLTYIQSTSCKMPGLINQKLESRLQKKCQ